MLKTKHHYLILSISGIVLLILFAFAFFMPFATLSPASATDTPTTRASGTPTLAIALGGNVALSMKPKSTPTFVSGSTTLRIATNNSANYVVSMSTANGLPTLAHEKASIKDTINALPTSSTPDNFTANTWGYALTTEATNSNTTYSAVPATKTTILEKDTFSSGSADDTYNLTFGVSATNQMPFGTYSNSVVVSVVANPIVISLDDITYMQDMTTAICADSAEHETKQLIDKRDNKSYWVAKLKDGHCWMVQNLDLDLSTTVALTPEDSDVTQDWVPAQSTSTVITNQPSDTDADYSWDPGMFVLKQPNLANALANPTAGNGYCANSANIGDCPYVASTIGMSPNYTATQSSSTDYTWYAISDNGTGDRYDAHYLLGNHYQWNAATAGSGKAISTQGARAAQSICPANWKLPLSGYDTDGISYDATPGSFYYLLDKYGLYAENAADSAMTSNAPLYFARAGNILSGTLNYIGYGTYLASSIAGSDTRVYNLAINYKNINPTNNANPRRYGFSVRCML